MHFSLQIPRTRLSTVGSCALSVFGPSTWNGLPLPLKHKPSLDSFKCNLKTVLFPTIDLPCFQFHVAVLIHLSLLPILSCVNVAHVYGCFCVCVGACVHACMRVCGVCVCACVRACRCVCVLRIVSMDKILYFINALNFIFYYYYFICMLWGSSWYFSEGNPGYILLSL